MATKNCYTLIKGGIMKKLMKRIKELEVMITVYSDRDRIRTKQLEIELGFLNMEVLSLMTKGRY